MGNSHSSSRAKHGNGSIKLKNKKIRQQLLVESGDDLETTNSQFCIPRNNQDIDRMQLQHFLFEHIWQNNYSSPIEPKLRSGDCRILDAGSGPGAWLLEMSTQHPSIKFVGVDIAAVFPTEIKPTNLEFQQCDINRGLPFKDNSFDFVRMSLMASSFKTDQWIGVIRELIRVLKPGGHLELIEKELQPYNTGPNFEIMIKNIMSFMSSNDLNINITQQIPSMLFSFPSLINIQSDTRPIPVGPLGGKTGIAYEELLEIYYKNKLIDFFPNYMNITEEEYLSLWEECKLEFTTNATTFKLFRFWAQKVVIDD